jgi:ABC-type sugar transport system permease subunit
MDWLRWLKRPLFWLMLAPYLIGLAVLVLMPLVWLVKLLIP